MIVLPNKGAAANAGNAFGFVAKPLVVGRHAGWSQSGFY